MFNSVQPKPNFFDARLRRTKEVSVGGHLINVKTLSCFDHIVFEKCRAALVGLGESADPVERLKAVTALLDAGKVNWKIAQPTELPDLILALVEVNQTPPPLAWQIPVVEEKEKKDEAASLVDETLAYEGRDIANLIAILAECFGWTADYILNECTLYEVNCYVQEAMVLQHQEHEMQYNLAEVGFEKVGDDYKKVPFPPLPWSKKVEIKISEKVKKFTPPPGYAPDGLIIDFTKMGPDGKVTTYEVPIVNKDSETQTDMLNKLITK